MPRYGMVPVANLVEPLHPDRGPTLMDGIDELVQSFISQGQLQNIGVKDLGDGRFRVIWGHRRSIAATTLRWQEIFAQIFQANEGDDETLKAHENTHRAQLTPIEEAVVYKRLRDEMGYSIKQIALTRGRSESTVAKKLALLDGDPDVLTALLNEDINEAEAHELNLFQDDAGRREFLQQTINGWYNARELKVQREHRDRVGQTAINLALAPIVDTLPPPVMEASGICQWGGHPVNLKDLLQPKYCCTTCEHHILTACEQHSTIAQEFGPLTVSDIRKALIMWQQWQGKEQKGA